jgi:hypothetical protein
MNTEYIFELTLIEFIYLFPPNYTKSIHNNKKKAI